MYRGYMASKSFTLPKPSCPSKDKQVVGLRLRFQRALGFFTGFKGYGAYVHVSGLDVLFVGRGGGIKLPDSTGWKM